MLEKSEFPARRSVVMVSPRAVKQLVKMGVDTTEDAGRLRNKGLRIIGGGIRMELDWPDLASFPNYGLTRTRLDFDQMLAKRAVEVGAELRTNHAVGGPLVDDATGRVVGVSATVSGEPRTFRAPIVMAADGVSGRFPIALGLNKRARDGRSVSPSGRLPQPGPARRRVPRVLARTAQPHAGRQAAPRVRLDLRAGGWPGQRGPGRTQLQRGVRQDELPRDAARLARLHAGRVGHERPGQRGRADPRGGAADGLFAGTPLRARRDARRRLGGMVNPFNGEGIPYAMESGELAAEIAVDALSRPTADSRERALYLYPAELKERYGGYYRLGGLFVKLIGNPRVMRLATRWTGSSMR
jgi:hypothetical protein